MRAILIELIFYAVVICLGFWVIDALPWPAIFHQVALVVWVVVAVLWALDLLMAFLNRPRFLWKGGGPTA